MTIKEILSAANITQQQMSDYFGIPKRTIENWCSSSPTNTRKCPDYLLNLMEYKLRQEGIINEA